MQQAPIELFLLRTLSFFMWRIHIYSFRNCLESMSNQTSVQDNRNVTELGAPLHEICVEGGSSRCVVEGSLLTNFLPARSYIITNI